MAIRPKLRPEDEEFSKIVASANSGGGDNDAPAAKGGKGGGKSVNPMAKEGSADYKTMQKANAPDSFYGYYDQNTGDYVPWYIDMVNGGGANQAGPTFEGGFGTARLAGGLLNAAGVSPYGQDRPRAFMPMEAYRGGDTVPFSQAPTAPAPTGVIDAVVEPLPSGPTMRGGRRGPRPVAPSGYPSMNMPSIQGYTAPMPQPAASVSDTAMTTPGMDFLMNMAQNTVMTKYPTMPAQEQQLRIDQEYQKLAQMLGY